MMQVCLDEVIGVGSSKSSSNFCQNLTESLTLGLLATILLDLGLLLFATFLTVGFEGFLLTGFFLLMVFLY
jgi:hypothetical protein